MTIRERYDHAISYFKEAYPEAKTELEYTDPFELIVAVMLSAQCTDKRVNMITPALMKKYPDAEAMAKAKPEEIYQYIKSCSYPNSKARHLSAMSKMLTEEFKGVVPSDLHELMKLPGVGRKSANVISSVVFRKPVIAVDTHVFRVANRIGLVKNARTPLAVELQLTKHFSPDIINEAHHWLILHGRYVCKARNPMCEKCGLTSSCLYYSKLKNRKK